jgi:SAM-dependent methyltransferase
MPTQVINRIKVRLIDALQILISLIGGGTSRTAEYRFVYRNLPPSGTKILDIGCCDSLLVLKLAKRDYQVTGIDARPYLEKHPNLTFIQADACRMPFSDANFDAVIAVSTIEHIGLGAYGDPVQEGADARVVKEIHRVLKPGGRLILTTPFAAKYRLASWRGGQERYYDVITLQRLLSSFEVIKKEYFIGKSRFRWVSATEEEAKNPVLRWHANVATVLEKKES